MPTIKFTRDTTADEGGPHKAGDTLDCSDASAEHWAKRGAAKAITKPPKNKAIKQPPKDKAVKRGDNPDK